MFLLNVFYNFDSSTSQNLRQTTYKLFREIKIIVAKMKQLLRKNETIFLFCHQSGGIQPSEDKDTFAYL